VGCVAMCDICASSASCNVHDYFPSLSFYNSLREKGWLTLQMVMFWGQLCSGRHLDLEICGALLLEKIQIGLIILEMEVEKT